MNTCLTIFLGFVIVTLITIYIIYLCNLHARVSRLEYKASPKLVIIEKEVHGIGCYLRIIIGIAILFCLLISIHYIAVFYPRFTDEIENGRYVENLGIDYWGYIIGFLTLIVTLLVGWNIYSNIKAKEELRATKEDIEKLFEKRIKELDNCCKHGQNKLDELERKHDAFEQDTNKKISNTRANMLRFMGITWSANLMGLSEITLLNRMLSTYIGSLSEYMQNDERDKADILLSHIMEDEQKIIERFTLPSFAKIALINKFTAINNYTDLDKADDFINFINSIPEQ